MVNDSGPEILREMLHELKRPVPVLYVRVVEDILWNYPGAVNLGFWVASGDIVAIEDTDHIPGRNVYRDAEIFFENPANTSIERLAFSRDVIEQTELSKPLEEWVVSRNWGPNDMVSIVRRSMYIRMKGQDERMSGRYGYMCYCYKARMKMLGVKSSKIHGYYAIVGDGGEPNMRRGLHPKNRSIYHENANRKDGQYAGGMLNFTYTFERLEPNV